MTTTRAESTASPLFHGIIVPMVTPLASQWALDEAALEALVDRLLTGGVHGLFLLGTCGEGASLSHELRQTMIERTCRLVAGRVPVLASVSDSSPTESVALARFAADAGATTIVVAPPFYLPLSQSELQNYFVRQADASPLPVMLYNMPALTKLEIEPETLRRLQDHPRIIGLKDSSGDLEYFAAAVDVVRRRSDWSVFMGPEQLLISALEMGADGGVSGGANVFPKLFVEMFNAATSGRRDELNALLPQARLFESVYESGPITAATVIKGLKAALACLEIGNGLVAEPLEPLASEDLDRIKHVVERLQTR
jgi:4-hydroxy-tetrahydrodipicolinate synthase